MNRNLEKLSPRTHLQHRTKTTVVKHNRLGDSSDEESDAEDEERRAGDQSNTEPENKTSR